MLIPFHIDTERDWEYSQDRPYLTWALLAAYIGIHTYIALHVETRQWVDLIYRYGVVKFDLHWYNFITCTFLHGGWLHLFGNCFFLWIYGSALERYLGTLRFAILYIAGAFFSMAVHVWTLSDFYIDMPAIGASGAISAVLGAFFVLLPKARIKCVFLVFLRPLIATLHAWVVLGFWFVVQLYFSLGDFTASESIAFWAHVAGFAAGAAFGSALYWQKAGSMKCEEQQDKQALTQGWAGFLSSGRQVAASHEGLGKNDQASLKSPMSYLLHGVAAGSNTSKRAGNLRRAFKRADNTLDYALALTTYLQLRQLVGAGNISPETHRAAGTAALACRQSVLGLTAYRDALRNGLEEGVDQVFERTAAVLKARFNIDVKFDV